LWLIVGADGRPRDIKVARAIGMGLDEKAIEAVRAWRFEPARKDGQPVAVQINVEVEFRLFGGDPSEIDKLWRRADAGDAKAQLKLAHILLEPPNTAADDEKGLSLLQKAAKQGLPEAQFQMGEYIYHRGKDSPDYVTAYMWYALARRGGYKRSEKALKEVASRMTPDQLAEAQKRVEGWTSDRDK
jgi:TonB family protein